MADYLLPAVKDYRSLVGVVRRCPRYHFRKADAWPTERWHDHLRDIESDLAFEQYLSALWSECHPAPKA